MKMRNKIAALVITLLTSVVGFTATAQAEELSGFVPIQPCRLTDTRAGAFHVGPHGTMQDNQTVTFDGWGITGECDLPDNTTALLMNVTAVDASAPTFLVMYPAEADLEVASALNPSPGQPPTPNAVTATLGPAGRFNAYNLEGQVDLIIDVTGYYVGISTSSGNVDIAALQQQINAVETDVGALQTARGNLRRDIDALAKRVETLESQNIEGALPGDIVQTTSTVLPPGWAWLDGSTLVNVQNTNVPFWNATPQTWKSGPDIVLPDMDGRRLQTETLDAIGRTGGVGSTTLNTSNLPSHSHGSGSLTVDPPAINAQLPNHTHQNGSLRVNPGAFNVSVNPRSKAVSGGYGTRGNPSGWPSTGPAGIPFYDPPDSDSIARSEYNWFQQTLRVDIQAFPVRIDVPRTDVGGTSGGVVNNSSEKVYVNVPQSHAVGSTSPAGNGERFTNRSPFMTVRTRIYVG